MFGYEAWVLLNGIFIPAQTADTDLDRARLDSSGIYGGSLYGTNMPIGQVHYYDWPNVTATFTAEASLSLLSILKEMILNRQEPITLILNSGETGFQKISQAWWNQISVSTGEDSLVSVSVNLTALERTDFDINDFYQYWSNENGGLGSQCLPSYDPIPFWKTKILNMDFVKSWNFTVSQEVVKFYGCMNYSGMVPKNPFIMGCGIVNATLSIVTHENMTEHISAMPSVYSGSNVNSRTSFTIKIGDLNWVTCLCELNRANDPISGITSLDEINYEFQVYGIS